MENKDIIIKKANDLDNDTTILVTYLDNIILKYLVDVHIIKDIKIEYNDLNDYKDLENTREVVDKFQASDNSIVEIYKKINGILTDGTTDYWLDKKQNVKKKYKLFTTDNLARIKLSDMQILSIHHNKFELSLIYSLNNVNDDGEFKKQNKNSIINILKKHDFFNDKQNIDFLNDSIFIGINIIDHKRIPIFIKKDGWFNDSNGINYWPTYKKLIVGNQIYYEFLKCNNGFCFLPQQNKYKEDDYNKIMIKFDETKTCTWWSSCYKIMETINEHFFDYKLLLNLNDSKNKIYNEEYFKIFGIINNKTELFIFAGKTEYSRNIIQTNIYINESGKLVDVRGETNYWPYYETVFDFDYEKVIYIFFKTDVVFTNFITDKYMRYNRLFNNDAFLNLIMAGVTVATTAVVAITSGVAEKIVDDIGVGVNDIGVDMSDALKSIGKCLDPPPILSPPITNTLSEKATEELHKKLSEKLYGIHERIASEKSELADNKGSSSELKQDIKNEEASEKELKGEIKTEKAEIKSDDSKEASEQSKINSDKSNENSEHSNIKNDKAEQKNEEGRETQDKTAQNKDINQNKDDDTKINNDTNYDNSQESKYGFSSTDTASEVHKKIYDSIYEKHKEDLGNILNQCIAQGNWNEGAAATTSYWTGWFFGLGDTSEVTVQTNATCDIDGKDYSKLFEKFQNHMLNVQQGFNANPDLTEHPLSYYQNAFCDTQSKQYASVLSSKITDHVTNNLSDISTFENQISLNDANIANLQTDIVNQQSLINSQNIDIQNQNMDIANQQTDIGNQQSLINSQNIDIQNQNMDIANQNNQETNLNNNISSQGNKINALNTTDTNLGTDISSQVKEVKGLNSLENLLSNDITQDKLYNKSVSNLNNFLKDLTENICIQIGLDSKIDNNDKKFVKEMVKINFKSVGDKILSESNVLIDNDLNINNSNEYYDFIKKYGLYSFGLFSKIFNKKNDLLENIGRYYNNVLIFCNKTLNNPDNISKYNIKLNQLKILLNDIIKTAKIETSEQLLLETIQNEKNINFENDFLNFLNEIFNDNDINEKIINEKKIFDENKNIGKREE